jgi:hypothetical protein
MNIAATELDRFTQNRLNARDRLQLHVSVPGLPGRREARETLDPPAAGEEMAGGATASVNSAR